MINRCKITYRQLLLEINKMAIEELSPWTTLREEDAQESCRSNGPVASRKHKNVSANLTPPVTSRYLNNILQKPGVSQSTPLPDQLVHPRNKRLSLNDAMRNRKEMDRIMMLPVLTNEYPLVPQMNTLSPLERFWTKAETPEVAYIEKLIDSQRKCVKLNLMPDLDHHTKNKKKSRSLLALHGIKQRTRYSIPGNSFHPYDPLRQNMRLEEMMHKVPKKEVKKKSSSYRPPVPHQTIKLLRFETKPEVQQMKPPSKARVQHFLDKFFERMC